jgi:hypothetical protein
MRNSDVSVFEVGRMRIKERKSYSGPETPNMAHGPYENP